MARKVLVLASVVLFAAPLIAAECVKVRTKAPHNPEAPVWYHVPKGYDAARRKPYPVLVYFGGRNWPGSRTVKAFGFDALADRMGLVLLSPSFSDGEYWRPETGTGETLAKAVGEVEGRCGLKRSKVFLYGYSAGGQCAALFAAHMKDRVAAWGAHACGVYPDVVPANGVPALITCGVDDSDRLRISRSFAYRYREGGGELVFKTYSCGHELPAAALSLAGAWLESLLDGGGVCAYGEDDTRQIASRDDIDPEFRNPFRTTRLMALWLK